MSLSQLYRLKRKAENKQDEKTLEEAENLKAKLEKIAIPPDIAKAWSENSCLPPDTMVDTVDGPIAIQEVHVGDKVLTHEGYHTVAETYSRPYHGELISLTPYYTNMPLLLTPNHPLLAIQTIKKCPANKDPRHFRICLPTCSSKFNGCPAYYKSYKPEWIQAEELEKGDAVCLCAPIENSEVVIDLTKFATKGYLRLGNSLVKIFPRKMNEKKLKKLAELYKDGFSRKEIVDALGISYDMYYRWLPRALEKQKQIKEYSLVKLPLHIKIDKQFASLAGYYVSEGDVHNHQICFSFNSEETKLVKKIKYLLKKLFSLNAFEKKMSSERCVRVIVGCLPLAKMFRELFGSRAENKRVPTWFLKLSPEILYAFIISYFQGDGYVKTSGRHGITASTTSKLLARQIRTIMTKLGIPAGIYKVKKEVAGSGNIGGRIIKHKHDVFIITVPSKAGVRMLMDMGGKPSSPCHRRPYGFKIGERLFICLKSIKRAPYKGRVYNLKVNPVGTYAAEGILVHNCGKPC